MLSGTPAAKGSYTITVKTINGDGTKPKYTLRLDVLKAAAKFNAAPVETVAAR